MKNNLKLNDLTNKFTDVNRMLKENNIDIDDVLELLLLPNSSKKKKKIKKFLDEANVLDNKLNELLNKIKESIKKELNKN